MAPEASATAGAFLISEGDNVTTYNNPLSADLAPVLKSLQRASVRCAVLHRERIDLLEPARAREAAHWLAIEVLGEEHADRIDDAYFGQYDTGDRVIPVFTKTGRVPEWALAASEELD